MRENNIGVLFFFSILGIIATTIFSSILMSQNSAIITKLENK
jgi:hypothetical protein